MSYTRTALRSGREDLNLRPPAPKAGALPGCATPPLKPPLSITKCAELARNRCGILNNGCRGHSLYLLVQEPAAKRGELFGVGAADVGRLPVIFGGGAVGADILSWRGCAPTSRAVCPAEDMRRTSGPRMRFMVAEMSG